MRRSNIVIILIILISFAVGIYFYPWMPEKVASHWNVRGEVDGYMSKFLSLFLMPIISVFLFLFFLLIPRVDPLKANIEKFRRYFDIFIILVILFLFYLYLLTIFWNLGVKFSMNQVLPPAFGILLFYSGILIENAKRNWFIGIRTPWTLSNEKVWERTHRIGGKLFKITGIVALLGVLFPGYAIFFVLIPVILVAIYTIVYSYFEYQKEMATFNKS
jgi:uncharacterized membrane protein